MVTVDGLGDAQAVLASGSDRVASGSPPMPLIVVAGPTASGKSALALALAERFRGVVINADAMQVYRELRVLTARPGPADEARAPHRLYGVLALAEACSAARWRALAVAEIAAARAAGRLPIVTGGTGLYLDVLLRGIAPVPPIPAEVMAAAARRRARLGAAAFHAALVARDPEAARLAPGDSQRTLRAWAVIEATGVPLGVWQRRAPAEPGEPARVFLLAPPRHLLYARCDARFVCMVEAGALAEVAALGDLDPALPGMKAVGVGALRRHLAGEITLAEAVAAAQKATRRYAKRQLTWFRHRLHPRTVIASPDGAEAIALASAETRRFLLTAPV